LRGTAVTPARGEEKGRLGALLAGTGHRGAAVRPLDGGALTRWGARTRGEGAGDGAWAHCSLSPSKLVARCYGRREEREQ